MVVQRRERTVAGVAQNLVHASLFDLAGEQRDAEIHGFLHLRGHARQHGQASGDMKAAHADLDPGCA